MRLPGTIAAPFRAKQHLRGGVGAVPAVRVERDTGAPELHGARGELTRAFAVGEDRSY
jgi:hypothetical protein